MKKNPFESGAKKYDSWFERHPHIFQSELNALKQCVEAGKKSIEIGIGTGVFAEKLGIKIGVEPSKDMANLAKTRGIEVIEGYAENLPIEEDSYEQALMITVDCFLNDVRLAFSEVRRILSSGGLFTIAIINKESALGQIYDKNKEKDEVYKWAEFRTAEEVIGLLEREGFKILKICQTVTDFEDRLYEVKDGHGEGVFTVIKSILEKNT